MPEIADITQKKEGVGRQKMVRKRQEVDLVETGEFQFKKCSVATITNIFKENKRGKLNL